VTAPALLDPESWADTLRAELLDAPAEPAWPAPDRDDTPTVHAAGGPCDDPWLDPTAITEEPW
jgi:hypothetical protein